MGSAVATVLGFLLCWRAGESLIHLIVAIVIDAVARFLWFRGALQFADDLFLADVIVHACFGFHGRAGSPLTAVALFFSFTAESPAVLLHSVDYAVAVVIFVVTGLGLGEDGLLAACCAVDALQNAEFAFTREAAHSTRSTPTRVVFVDLAVTVVVLAVAYLLVLAGLDIGIALEGTIFARLDRKSVV